MRSIDELRVAPGMALPDAVLTSDTPVVLRGLVAHWPLVGAAQASTDGAVALLREHAASTAVNVMVGAPDIEGRLFYTDDMQGLNFRNEQPSLQLVLDALQRYQHDPRPPMVYLGSTTVQIWFPGLADQHTLDLGARDPLFSIWIGNRTRVAAHQDLPDNLACVAAGRRRFTLFPPEQLPNLYVGPLDFTPAGQPISLVDLHAPDLERFPRFTDALAVAQVAELGPGDAIFIPSMWWHHVEALAPFNVLLNYWWRQSPAHMDTPMHALMLAMMSVRDLPPAQRDAWRSAFEHYVFHADPAQAAAHVPDAVRRMLASPMNEATARGLRGYLLQRLNR